MAESLTLIEKLRALGYRAEDLLQGEYARFLFYGAAIIVWAVVGIANALGYTRFGVTLSLNDALIDATAAGAVLTELIRRGVYSKNTVQAVALDAAINAAEAEHAAHTQTEVGATAALPIAESAAADAVAAVGVDADLPTIDPDQG